MTLVRLNEAVVTDMRGSAGGGTFRRSNSGLILQRRPLVRNKKNQYQMAIQQRFSFLSSNWQPIDTLVKESWNSASVDFPAQNKVGEFITLSGFDLYLRCGLNALLVNQSPPLLPPPPITVPLPEITNFTANFFSGFIEFNYNPNTYPISPAYIVFYVSDFWSTGTFVVKTTDIKFQAFEAQPWSGFFQIPIASFLIKNATPWHVGQKLFGAAKIIDGTTYIDGGFTITSVISA